MFHMQVPVSLYIRNSGSFSFFLSFFQLRCKKWHCKVVHELMDAKLLELYSSHYFVDLAVDS